MAIASLGRIALVSFLVSGCIDRVSAVDPLEPGDAASDAAVEPDAGVDADPDAAPRVAARIAGDDVRPIALSGDDTVLLVLEADRYGLHHLPTGRRVDLGFGPPGFAHLADDGRSVLWLDASNASGAGVPERGLSIWTPGEPDTLVTDRQRQPQRGYLAGGRFVYEGEIIYRLGERALIEVMRIETHAFTDYHPSPSSPARILVTSRDERGGVAWYIDLESGLRREMPPDTRFVRWSGRFLVYSETHRGPMVAWDVEADRRLLIEDPQSIYAVLSAHQPPLAAWTGLDGVLLARFGDAPRPLPDVARPLLGWRGDWLITQTADGSAIALSDTMSGASQIVPIAADTRYYAVHDGRFLLGMSEAGGVQPRRQRLDPWSGARVDLGPARRLSPTHHPDVFTGEGDALLLLTVDGAEVDRLEVDDIVESPDGTLLALRRGEAWTALDLRTRRARVIHPGDLAIGPLREHVLGNVIFVARVGLDGASALWVLPTRWSGG